MIGSALAQPRATAFEVASIRANPNCGDGFLSRGAPGPTGLFVECADLRDLILTAYAIHADDASRSLRTQVIGGPRWMDTQRFNISATAPARTSQSEILGPMLRALLEERFGLRVHRETKDGSIYNLTVARGGPKLKASTDGSARVSIHPSGTVDLHGVTMSDLCGRLGMALDREVTDATGLAGRYDFQLRIAASDLNPRFVAGRDLAEAGAPTDVEHGSSIFSALRELGLNLESARGPVSSIIVDRIESLTEN